MKIKYYEDDDILVIKLSEAPVVKEISQDWNIHISYDENDNIVQIVFLEAKEKGLYPVLAMTQKAA